MQEGCRRIFAAAFLKAGERGGAHENVLQIQAGERIMDTHGFRKILCRGLQHFYKNTTLYL